MAYIHIHIKDVANMVEEWTRLTLNKWLEI